MSKQCSTCNVMFTPKNANDRHSDCRDCVNARRREIRRKARPDIVAHEAELDTGRMTCNECKINKPLSEFRPKRRKCKACCSLLEGITHKAEHLDSLIKTIQAKLEEQGLKYHKSKLYIKLTNMPESNPEFVISLINDIHTDYSDYIGDKLVAYIKSSTEDDTNQDTACAAQCNIANADSSSNSVNTHDETEIAENETEIADDEIAETNDIEIPFEDNTKASNSSKKSVIKINYKNLLNNSINLSKPEAITTHPLNIPALKGRPKMSPEKEALIKACRSRLQKIFKSKGLGKQKRTHEYIGCDYDFLMKWLSFNLQAGMTLENRGAVWHIDHVLPLSSFDLQADENHVCFHWVNLAPLTATENLSKGNRTQHEQVCAHFENLVKFLKQENLSLEPQYLELFARHLTNRGTP